MTRTPNWKKISNTEWQKIGTETRIVVTVKPYPDLPKRFTYEAKLITGSEEKSLSPVLDAVRDVREVIYEYMRKDGASVRQQRSEEKS